MQSSGVMFGASSDTGCRLRTGRSPSSTATDMYPEYLLRLSLPLSGTMSPEYCPWHLIQHNAQLQYTVKAVGCC
jgi:hypothetical protein